MRNIQLKKFEDLNLFFKTKFLTLKKDKINNKISEKIPPLGLKNDK